MLKQILVCTHVYTHYAQTDTGMYTCIYTLCSNKYWYVRVYTHTHTTLKQIMVCTCVYTHTHHAQILVCTHVYTHHAQTNTQQVCTYVYTHHAQTNSTLYTCIHTPRSNKYWHVHMYTLFSLSQLLKAVDDLQTRFCRQIIYSSQRLTRGEQRTGGQRQALFARLSGKKYFGERERANDTQITD